MRQHFQNADLILVNGNHHEAAAQIVVIDPAKEASLRKRLHQLTDVRLILLANVDTQVFDFVENVLPNPDAVPRLYLDDTAGVIQFFEREMAARTPLLNGLVLAGGRSQRMGRDKSQLNWHGKPQREHVADLLRPFCEEVLVSCRPEQAGDLPAAYPALPDTFVELGPYGAILSAFRAQPDRAWLVVACDLPLLDAATLDFLVNARQPKHLATAFVSPRDQMPEPLIAIWEPKSYPELLAFLGQGYSCPRKVLLNTDSHLVLPPNPAALSNANTPEDLQQLGLG
jgi:molybdopterin-guanine dinucleotide biosynthesis protein A